MEGRSEEYIKTTILLESARRGDLEAREELYRRILPRLERFAHGRVPPSLRRMVDTQEIVQDTVLRSLRRLESFESRGEGAFMQYLGKAIINRIRDAARRHRGDVSFGEEERFPGREPTPVEQAIGAETFRKYQEALETLTEDQRTAVVLHVEMGYSLQELGEVLGRNSEAARKVLCRALENLRARMRVER